MTVEQNKAFVDADVKRQLAPKRPEPRLIIDPEKAKRTLDALQRPPPPPLLDDYDRSIVTSHRQMKRSRSSSSSAPRTGKTIPQLGEQGKQSYSPLKVFADIANDPGIVDAYPGITLGDYISDDVEFLVAEVVTFKYQNGQPLVKPDQVPHLSTMMRRVHQWYLDACKNGTDNIYVRVKNEHFFNGEEMLFVEFTEIFQLYNQLDIDKAIVSCYCP